MTIRAFNALRPKDPKQAGEIAALPYDVMNSEEAKAAVEGKPWSFLHVDKAEIDLPPETDPHDDEVYAKAKENLQKMIDQEIYMREKKPTLYIYQLEANGRTQTGVAACVSVEEYKQGIIKRHELTRPDKELDRIKHIKATEAHTGPIFMAYRDNGMASAPKNLMDAWIKIFPPLYDFKAEDGVSHRLWPIDANTVRDGFIKAFDAIDCIYIADGHHRNEAASKAADPANEESQYYLAVIFPHDELAILEYNRVVKDLNGHDKNAFIAALKNVASVEESATPVQPANKYEMGLYMAGQWYKLNFPTPSEADIIKTLDVSVLQDKVLAPLLGINDPREDSRIDFVGGIRGLTELERRVNSGEMAVAFSMYPTSMEELMAVADAGQIMPPKSTWFEPKLRSGLLIHSTLKGEETNEED